jgi:hypothetical protein
MVRSMLHIYYYITRGLQFKSYHVAILYINQWIIYNLTDLTYMYFDRNNISSKH